MLKITIPASELYDEKNNEFIYLKEQTLLLEHSLVSVAKWEAQKQKPFLSEKNMSVEDSIDYIRCMTITQNVDPLVYKGVTRDILKKVDEYIRNPMTATWFGGDKDDKKSKKVITSEIIYYWMIAHNIPYKYEKWHLNRLLTLIRICNIENAPKQKMSQKDTLKRNKALNDARRKGLKTRG